MSKYKKGDMVQVVDGGSFHGCEQWFVPGKYYYVFDVTSTTVELSDRHGESHEVTFNNLIKLEEPDYEGMLATLVRMNQMVLDNIEQTRKLRESIESCQKSHNS